MAGDVKQRVTSVRLVLVISTLAVLISFLLQGHIGLNLWDEGFLWYGVQRVLKGEVPVRDFMSYEPGRYYWTAMLLSVTGDDGIMSVRAAVALFQGLGLFVALLLLAQSERPADKDTVPFLCLSACVLVLWMFPRHKLFDISLSIFLIGALTHLVRQPTATRYILSGFCVGVIAFFGRNHGLYGAVASVGAISWIHLRDSSVVRAIRGALLWMVGMLFGFMPMVLMSICIPGFFSAFMESVMFLWEQKATNLPLPVPWPWTVDSTKSTMVEAFRGFLLGLFFLATLIFSVSSVVWVVYQRLKRIPVSPVLVAAAFSAIPYTHYAYSRADVGHLAQGIFPLLIGWLFLIFSASPFVRWSVGVGLLAASCWIMGVLHPAGHCYGTTLCVETEVSGSLLWMDPMTAGEIAMLREIGARYAPDDRAFLVAPVWPGAYALLERRSPMWEIFALFPRSERFEQREIERIKAAAPGFALLMDIPLDGRDDLRFRKTHPLIHQYIVENFDKEVRALPPTMTLYKARGAPESNVTTSP